MREEVKYYKFLYKKDTKGKIRMLQVIAGSNGTLIQESGIVNTENPVRHEKTCKGKNIGRSNETTPEQQAVKEAEALVRDKLTKGYFETIQEAEQEIVILPMLAKDYKKESHKIDWEHDIIISQPKYDGMRALCFCNEEGKPYLLSREGKIINNMDHILKEFSLVKENVVFDGELYTKEDFQTNMSYIKDYQPGLTEQIKFYCYDIVSDKIFTDRVDYIEEFNTDILSDAKNIIWVSDEQVHIFSEDELKEQHSLYLNLGYEGTILRLNKSGYKINGRSSDLLKYKDFKDIACKIVDIGPAKQRPEWARPVVEYNGKRFACGLKMSHEARKEMLINKENYIGKIMEVRFFEFSQDGIPRFPIGFGIREDKSIGDAIK